MNNWIKIIDLLAPNIMTPCYIYNTNSIFDNLQYLKNAFNNIPIKYWLSFKTHPLRKLIDQWYYSENGIEVVSEYELLAALSTGFKPNRILVNGPAKHNWLYKYTLKNLNVNFDSINEISYLLQQARNQNWVIGLRVKTSAECDVDDQLYGGQFGLSSDEINEANIKITDFGLRVDTIHFHLGSDIIDENLFQKALDEIAIICTNYNVSPLFIDCGGGLPSLSRCNSFNYHNYYKIIANIFRIFPSAKEIWLENGRFLTSNTTILLIKILDIKDRPECRYYICDGGRTNHALVSDWEKHNIGWYPNKTGAYKFSTICGPTCMHFDRLDRLNLPTSLSIGDFFIWYDAGAYHIPWETRFSNGLVDIISINNHDNIETLRIREDFHSWWRQH